MYFLRAKAHGLLYSLGLGGLFLLNHALLIMIVYRYDSGSNISSNINSVPTPFISSVVVGILMLTMRGIGAIAMPGIGYFSNQFSSRWGRRRPFMAASLLPLTLCFLLIFIPPAFNSFYLSLYLALLLLLFYLAFGAYQVPYLAWLSTVVRSPQEHVTVSTYMAITSLLGTLIAGIGAPLIVERDSFISMAIAIALIGSLAMLAPLLVKETTTSAPVKPLSIKAALQQGWQDSFFRTYLISLAAAWIAVSMLSVCSTFIAVALLGQPVSFGALINGIVVVGALLGAPFVPRLVQKLGQQKAFQFSMSWIGSGFLSISILSFTHTAPPLWVWVSLLLLTSLGLSGFFVLPNAMLSTAVSQQSAQGEPSRESVYFGIRGLFVETSIGFGAFLSGLALTLGKTASNPLGIQLALIIAGGLALLSAYAFTLFSCAPVKSGAGRKTSP
ncbi:MAG: MFS transporter [Phormidesmis sp.]